jgi:hypothetical protein
LRGLRADILGWSYGYEVTLRRILTFFESIRRNRLGTKEKSKSEDENKCGKENFGHSAVGIKAENAINL